MCVRWRNSVWGWAGGLRCALPLRPLDILRLAGLVPALPGVVLPPVVLRRGALLLLGVAPPDRRRTCFVCAMTPLQVRRQVVCAKTAGQNVGRCASGGSRSIAELKGDLKCFSRRNVWYAEIGRGLISQWIRRELLYLFCSGRLMKSLQDAHHYEIQQEVSKLCGRVCDLV